ncbi:universal stress protein [Marinactinospora thermotolerans]|uniref:Nucleotide-binding universal stress protein, UspA family n=1 Tax=Marinactinospora thermotolerans DSM 45154 TaxID=1122192 RepID=A0A1T4KI00_9ACTN|nr:universal stress protein [Marinactinospora thermotolerans]SJZ42034.1 Nucleotide-binding universal stress protein, UspA family [Marinactinospora thermotolerans DSM 45154]
MNDHAHLVSGAPPRDDDVVVGVDGSAGSQAATVWAAEAAHRRGAGLRVVHAASMPLVTMPLGHSVRMPPTPEVAERASALLGETVERARQVEPELRVGTELSALDPSHALIAASRHAQLVVVGTRGASGVRSRFTGAVGIRVSAHAECPVAVVPSLPHTPLEVRERRHVIVGTDGSPGSDAALEFAFEEAILTESPLTVVHAWRMPAMFDPVMTGDVAVDLRDTVVSQAEQSVRTQVEQIRPPDADDLPVRITIVEEQPAHALLSAAEEARLIVVGSRGRGGFRGLLLGSVSQALLHHAHVPVVVTRIPRHAADRGPVPPS